nr:hypothetical protein Itr_chr13CG08050 [Ipomoea trifida]
MAVAHSDWAPRGTHLHSCLRSARVSTVIQTAPPPRIAKPARTLFFGRSERLRDAV